MLSRAITPRAFLSRKAYEKTLGLMTDKTIRFIVKLGLAPFSFDRQYLWLCVNPVFRKRKRLFLRLCATKRL